ncbi:hypothetical protein [Halobaculum rarum]|uniref:hypothetical protein n=1 Tax=Halobaculum rarum TaxID=3075122 RepID=UPI0032AFDB96
MSIGIVDRIATLLAPERADVYRCRGCDERVRAPVGAVVDECPKCGSADVALITRHVAL